MKCFCDECGAEGAGRATVNLARSEPLKLPVGHTWKYDRDLCQRCFDDLVSKFDSLLVKAKV